ncbi:MAG TPA: hypothetical protein VIK39_06770 [Candidatus Angelobacter sp.]
MPGKSGRSLIFLGQRGVCPLYNLLKAFGICGVGHEANFTTRTSGETWAPAGERSPGDNCCKIAVVPRIKWSKPAPISTSEIEQTIRAATDRLDARIATQEQILTCAFIAIARRKEIYEDATDL